MPKSSRQWFLWVDGESSNWLRCVNENSPSQNFYHSILLPWFYFIISRGWSSLLCLACKWNSITGMYVKKRTSYRCRQCTLVWLGIFWLRICIQKKLYFRVSMFTFSCASDRYYHPLCDAGHEPQLPASHAIGVDTGRLQCAHCVRWCCPTVGQCKVPSLFEVD